MATQKFDRSIQVVGLGYIGLPTAAVLASRGYKVHGVEINPSVVSTINAGNIHIEEPNLDVAVRTAVLSGHLKASTQPQSADIHLIAVPTPFKEEGGSSHRPDLSYVFAAFRSIVPSLRAGDLVVLESTSPVGTTLELERMLKDLKPELARQVHLAYCPERVLPGRIIQELIGNDRVVGGLTNEATTLAVGFYKTFVEGEVFPTTAAVAEMVKLSENAFRDVNVAFANELSLICDRLAIPVWDVISLANRHPRVKILRPGTGVGGHCIAVDPWFLIDACPDESRLLHAARTVNDSKPHWVAHQVRRAWEKARAEGREFKLGVFGLTFKPDVDDIRESPAIVALEKILSLGIPVQGVADPHVRSLPYELQGSPVRLVDTEDLLRSCTAAVFLVQHSEFSRLESGWLKGKEIIDPVGLFPGYPY